MMEPGKNILRSMIAMKSDLKMAPLYVWFTESLRIQDKQNRRLTGDPLGWGQGASQVLETVIQKIDSAEETLKKLESAPEGKDVRDVPKNW